MPRVACLGSASAPSPLWVLVAVLSFGCSSGGSSAVVDGGAAETGAAPTFTSIYTNIVSQHCTPCHTSASGSGVTVGHLDMSSPATAYANLVNAPAGGAECGGKGTRVVPGEPQSSILYLKVSPTDPAPCGAKMPYGSPGLAQADADAIRAWIQAGARNDSASAPADAGAGDAAFEGDATSEASTATDASTPSDASSSSRDGSTPTCSQAGGGCSSNANCCSHSCDLQSYTCN